MNARQYEWQSHPGMAAEPLLIRESLPKGDHNQHDQYPESDSGKALRPGVDEGHEQTTELLAKMARNKGQQMHDDQSECNPAQPRVKPVRPVETTIQALNGAGARGDQQGNRHENGRVKRGYLSRRIGNRQVRKFGRVTELCQEPQKRGDRERQHQRQDLGFGRAAHRRFSAQTYAKASAMASSRAPQMENTWSKAPIFITSTTASPSAHSTHLPPSCSIRFATLSNTLIPALET